MKTQPLAKGALTGLFLLLGIWAQAQKLVYSLSYTDTQAGFHARYPTGALGATPHAKLAMLRSLLKSETYSVSLVDGQRSLLFSDADMDLEISPTGGAVGANKAYVIGVEHEWRTSPVPGAYAEPPAIYELNLDGSKLFRRFIRKQENQSPIFLNPQETKAAIQNFVDGKYLISIYEFPSWNLLHKWALTKLTEIHCPDCMPLSFGWLADGEHLFFNLDIVDDDGEDQSAKDVPGVYFASEEGNDLGPIPPLGPLTLAGFTRPNYLISNLLGQLPGGSYMFQDYATRQGAAPGNAEGFLVTYNSESKQQKHFPLRPRIRPLSWSMSPSGKYLAFIEDRLTQNYRTESHLWVMDLESGEEKELLNTPAPNPPHSLEPNVAVTILGWLP
jgi:hypothetical protein